MIVRPAAAPAPRKHPRSTVFYFVRKAVIERRCKLMRRRAVRVLLWIVPAVGAADDQPDDCSTKNGTGDREDRQACNDEKRPGFTSQLPDRKANDCDIGDRACKQSRNRGNCTVAHRVIVPRRIVLGEPRRGLPLQWGRAEIMAVAEFTRIQTTGKAPELWRVQPPNQTKRNYHGCHG
jgi:hypothetical protein